MSTGLRDDFFMGLALDAARAAGEAGEVPVGAVLVDEASGAVLATAGNAPIASADPTAHAEVLVLRAATRAAGNYRLRPGLTVFVTLEPCAMCAGALSLARVSRLVWGADDPKGGGVRHGARVFDQPTCHWRPTLGGGVRDTEAAALLRDFFRRRRPRRTREENLSENVTGFTGK
jgi:tRNA(Arg) A34 adenosine deaminase TadA